jgi:L-alanine-DL-glutamate epimerase-like enolase superfamily enzyme
MRISEVETFILHVPVTRNGIADSTHAVTHWGLVGCEIRTDDGVVGYGYTGTHAHLESDRLLTQCIQRCLSPLLIGADPIEVRHLWQKLAHHPPVQWVGRTGLTHLAVAAVDVALWDIKAKAVQQPLWKLLGGSASKRIEGYNTDGGWLNWETQTLVDDCRRQVEEQGYRGVKIKVGSVDAAGHFDTSRDLRRVEAVRRAVGDGVKLMVDANGRWNLPTAIQVDARLAQYEVYWLEEPLWYDDVRGHAELAKSISTPIALGEQLYRLDQFREFLHAGATHFVQADAVRLGGVTEWWEAADLAHAYRLPVVPHIGDMMQLHLPLSIAHPACSMLEYIPWVRECFIEPATVRDGYFVPPVLPGANTALRPEAIERFALT